MAGDENDWDSVCGIVQFFLELQPIQAGHLDIEQYATGCRILIPVFDKFIRRCEAFSKVGGRLQQPHQTLANRSIVVHYKNSGKRLCHSRFRPALMP